MDLVIVESPTKARTLSKFLGKEYAIEASMGHVRDLPEKGGGLAIDIEHDFEPNYQILSSKKKRVSELRALAKRAKVIYLATDPDREGEAISFHVQFLLGKHEYKRVTFHEITKTAILDALSKPGKVNIDLVNAQQARRVLDRLVGYTLSPVLWKKVRRGLSAGRVQSVAVELIVDKEQEITKFVPDEYWEIKVDLKAEDDLQVELVKENGKTLKITNEEQAKKIITILEESNYQVSDVVLDKQKNSPLPPFTTSLLQRAGSNMFGYSAKQTMQIAQSLYERGLITYHRTDSYNLSSEAITMAREYIESEYGREYLPTSPRVYKTKAASAQEAHEAIRPTSLGSDAVLEGREKKLYNLIVARFLQSQMMDAIFDKSTIIVKATIINSNKYYELKADGKRMIFDGYLKLGKKNDDVYLPSVVSGQVLLLTKVLPTQKFTQPPARYSEAGLIKELEKRGIGRPSTYAAIISTIQDRGYVTKEEKRFRPTAVGIAVVEFLVTNFATVMAYEFTARMESDLDAVAEGKKEWVSVVREFWNPLSVKVKEVEETGPRVKVAVESTGEKCPKCTSGEVVIRTGKFGKFLSCSLYPQCEYKAPFVEYAGNALCPTCKSRVVIKKSRKGKFFGCEKYPECKWAAWRLPTVTEQTE